MGRPHARAEALAVHPCERFATLYGRLLVASYSPRRVVRQSAQTKVFEYVVSQSKWSLNLLHSGVMTCTLTRCWAQKQLPVVGQFKTALVYKQPLKLPQL